MSSQQNTFIVLGVVVIFVLWWVSRRPEGYHTPPGKFGECGHIDCWCIDQNGQMQGSIRVDTEFRGLRRGRAVCRIKDHKKACEYCRKSYAPYDPEMKFRIGACYWNISHGGILERKHCPGYREK